MSDPAIPPPTFLRRHAATNDDTEEVLVGLACDSSYWVRRDAVRNPATPRWIIDLLVRAGSDPQLRGRAKSDPTMPEADLRRLVECGPWAQTLVVDHPNASAEVLAALATVPDDPTRRAVARHLNTSEATIGSLLADADESVRACAARHPHRPEGQFELLVRAGSDETLTGINHSADLSWIGPVEIEHLARLGPWGRFLAGRQAACPPSLLMEIAADSEWQIRSGILDNPEVPVELILQVAGLEPDADAGALQALGSSASVGAALDGLAACPAPEVRLAVARHPRTSSEAIASLAVDSVVEVRRTAARHRSMDSAYLDLLVRGGSTPDLAQLSEPADTVTPDEIARLAAGGYWARQIAVCHPSAAPETLAHLLCDEDPKLREWAAAHPSAPTDVIADIRRAGGAQDFQGVVLARPGSVHLWIWRLPAVHLWDPRRR